MSILIKDIEIPKKHITLTIFPNGYVAIYDEKDSFIGETKAFPIPKHGRLIDADALMGVIRAHDYPLTAHFNSTDNGMFTLGIQQAVDEAPTIIPAEEN